jgi:hypothetical protein
VSPTHGRLTGRQSPCPYSVLCSRLFVSVRMFDGRTDGRTDGHTRQIIRRTDTHGSRVLRRTDNGKTHSRTREILDGIVQLTGEFVNGQTIGQLTGDFVRRTDNWSTHWRICTTDGQLVNSLANSYDGQTIGQLSLANLYDRQTICQLTGKFVRRTDNWSTHWRICMTDRHTSHTHNRLTLTTHNHNHNSNSPTMAAADAPMTIELRPSVGIFFHVWIFSLGPPSLLQYTNTSKIAPTCANHGYSQRPLPSTFHLSIYVSYARLHSIYIFKLDSK